MATKTHKSPFIWLVLLIASVVGLIAVGLHFRSHYLQPIAEEQRKDEYLARLQNQSQNYPTSVWASNYKPNTYDIGIACESFNRRNESIIVFEHGTCVKIVGQAADPVRVAKASIRIAARPNSSFSVTPLANHNYVVTFDKYVNYLILAEEVVRIKDSILEHPSLKPVKPHFTADREPLPEFHIRLGKFARALMLEDAKQLKIAQVIQSSF